MPKAIHDGLTPQQRWNRNHPGEAEAYARTWRTANKNKVKGYTDKWWRDNKEVVKTSRQAAKDNEFKTNPKLAWFKYTFYAAQTRARKRGIPFGTVPTGTDIPALPDYCPILGVELRYTKRGNSGPDAYSPSLDRIKPELGYIKGNIRVISNRANTLKNNATVEELRAILRDLETLC